jgi:outer membrane receptor protein involved in Fe transport
MVGATVVARRRRDAMRSLNISTPMRFFCGKAATESERRSGLPPVSDGGFFDGDAMIDRVVTFVGVGIGAGASFLLAGTALAEGQEPVKKLETVNVVGHYENGVGTSDAASAGSVTAKLLENRPALRPGEILEFVPGVIVTQHSGDGKANQYFLRGFNLDHGTDFQTTVAGIPINMRTHAHGQGYTDLNFLIPELVERVDYKKGPYYAELGDFANAGAAQMKLFDRLPRGIASMTVGKHNFTRGLVANSADVGAGSLLYAVDLSRNDGPWKEPENFHKTNGVLRYASGDADNGFNVTGMAYSAHWDSTDQIPARAVATGSIDRFGSLDPSDGGETHRYSLSFEGATGNTDGRSDLSVYALESDLKLYSNFTFFLGNPVDGDQFNQAEDRRMYGFNTGHTWFGTLFGRRSDTRIGLEGRYDKLDPVALYATAERERLSTTRRDEVEELSAGVYLSNNTKWNDWLRTIVGARFDSYRFDVDSNLEENAGSRNDTITSPKLSVVLGPWAHTEFFVNYGEGFHSNDARGTTQHVTPSGDPAESVSPLVKSRGSEMGARSEIVPGLQSSLSVWQLKLDSELVFVGDAGDTEATRSSKRYGVEWSNHYKASDWLLVDLDLSASHARFTEDAPEGNYIPGSVDKVASFGVTLTDLGPWFAEFQVRYFGPRPLIEDDSVRSSSTTLAYLRGGYRFSEDWKATVDVFNLFDREVSDIDYYYASRLQGEPAEGVEDRHFHPVEPRTVRVSLTYNF